MSTNLRPVLQTNKVQTLPDDLKAIAEEMLARKFPEEVKRDTSRDPFRQEYPPHGHSINGAFREQYVDIGRMGRGVQVRINPYTRERVAIAFIGEHGGVETGIIEAMRELDMKGIPYRARKICIHPRRMHFLKMEHRAPLSHNHKINTVELYGCEVVVVPNHMDETVEVSF